MPSGTPVVQQVLEDNSEHGTGRAAQHDPDAASNHEHDPDAPSYDHGVMNRLRPTLKKANLSDEPQGGEQHCGGAEKHMLVDTHQGFGKETPVSDQADETRPTPAEPERLPTPRCEDKSIVGTMCFGVPQSPQAYRSQV